MQNHWDIFKILSTPSLDVLSNIVICYHYRNSYRQRNVFLYSPQKSTACESSNNVVSGDGECGVNGNTKIFQAGKLVDIHCSGE